MIEIYRNEKRVSKVEFLSRFNSDPAAFGSDPFGSLLPLLQDSLSYLLARRLRLASLRIIVDFVRLG